MNVAEEVKLIIARKTVIIPKGVIIVLVLMVTMILTIMEPAKVCSTFPDKVRRCTTIKSNIERDNPEARCALCALLTSELLHAKRAKDICALCAHAHFFCKTGLGLIMFCACARSA